MNPFMYYLILAGFLVFAMVTLWLLGKTAGGIHRELDSFRKRAEKASTLPELMSIHRDLLIYANKECWHKHLAAHAREVISYIQGKAGALS